MSTPPATELRKVILFHCAATAVDAVHTSRSSDRSQREIRTIDEHLQLERLWETAGEADLAGASPGGRARL